MPNVDSSCIIRLSMSKSVLSSSDPSDSSTTIAPRNCKFVPLPNNLIGLQATEKIKPEEELIIAYGDKATLAKKTRIVSVGRTCEKEKKDLFGKMKRGGRRNTEFFTFREDKEILKVFENKTRGKLCRSM